MLLGAWNTTPDWTVEAGHGLTVVQLGDKVGPEGDTVIVTSELGAEFPSWSLTSTPNTRLSPVGTRSPVFRRGVIDRNCVPSAKIVTTAFR